MLFASFVRLRKLKQRQRRHRQHHQRHLLSDRFLFSFKITHLWAFCSVSVPARCHNSQDKIRNPLPPHSILKLTQKICSSSSNSDINNSQKQKTYPCFLELKKYCVVSGVNNSILFRPLKAVVTCLDRDKAVVTRM